MAKKNNENNSEFIRITNKDVWNKLNSIEIMVKEYMAKNDAYSKTTRKIATAGLSISTFIAGALIVSALRG